MAQESLPPRRQLWSCGACAGCRGWP